MTAETQQLPLKVGAEVRGQIKHLGRYGALVDIGTGQDALLHISQLTGDEQPGAKIKAYVFKTRQDGHVALALSPPNLVPWQSIKPGSRYTGQVTRVENFGIFVDFGAARPGMVHVSEMADGYVKSPADVVSVGQEVEVRVLKKKSGRSRQIDLSMKPLPGEAAMSADDADEEDVPTSMAQAFQRAMAGQQDGQRGNNSSVTDRRSSKREFRAQQDDIIARTLRSSQS